MQRLSFAVLLTVLALSEHALGQTVYYAPHVIFGSPDPSHSWRTDFDILNPSATLTAHVTINLKTADGRPLATMPYGPRLSGVSTYSFTVLPLRRVAVHAGSLGPSAMTAWASIETDIPVNGTALLVEADSVHLTNS